MEIQYSLFYTYRKLDDVFAIVFHNFGKVTSKIKRGNVEALFSDKNLCGYNIYNIKDIVKIKVKGLIYLPNKELIDLINALLINNSFEPIPYILHSGYLISKVVDDNHVDIGGFIIKVDNNIGLDKDSIVVTAIAGTMLPNESIIEEGHACTLKDLSISDEDSILKLEENCIIGNDFFQMEEKQYVGD